MAQIKTPVGNAPLIPVMLLVGGGYLAWFGVHYWRQDIRWPSDPLKSLLTGKGIPASVPPPTVHSEFISAISTTTGQGAGSSSPIASGSGSAIAAAAMKYNGLPGYVYGGPADRPGNWDCSSFVSYVLGHDLHLPLPGGKWGDPGFPPHSHGPATGQYALYGKPINRQQVQAGDLIVWRDHIAIATSNTRAISAHNAKMGTSEVDLNVEDIQQGGGAHYRRVAG